MFSLLGHTVHHFKSRSFFFEFSRLSVRKQSSRSCADAGLEIGCARADGCTLFFACLNFGLSAQRVRCHDCRPTMHRIAREDAALSRKTNNIQPSALLWLPGFVWRHQWQMDHHTIRTFWSAFAVGKKWPKKIIFKVAVAVFFTLWYFFDQTTWKEQSIELRWSDFFLIECILAGKGHFMPTVFLILGGLCTLRLPKNPLA